MLIFYDLYKLLKFIILPANYSLTFLRKIGLNKAMIHKVSQTGYICENGVRGIVSMFTSPKKRPNQQHLKPIQLMYAHVGAEMNRVQVRENMVKICRFINGFYLLQMLKRTLIVSEFQHSVCDKKIIKVIILSYKIVYLDRFIQGAAWRGKSLDNFIQFLKDYKNQKLFVQLNSQRISNEDLQFLFSTSSFMISQSNMNCYLNIIQSLKKCQFNLKEMEVFMEKFIVSMYSFFGRIVEETIFVLLAKVSLLYTLCSIKCNDDKLNLQLNKSQIKNILIWEGYETIEHLTKNLSRSKLMDEKKISKSLLEMNTIQSIQERDSESQESIRKLRANTLNQKQIPKINVRTPKKT